MTPAPNWPRTICLSAASLRTHSFIILEEHWAFQDTTRPSWPRPASCKSPEKIAVVQGVSKAEPGVSRGAH